MKQNEIKTSTVCSYSQMRNLLSVGISSSSSSSSWVYVLHTHIFNSESNIKIISFLVLCLLMPSPRAELVGSYAVSDFWLYLFHSDDCVALTRASISIHRVKIHTRVCTAIDVDRMQSLVLPTTQILLNDDRILDYYHALDGEATSATSNSHFK